MQASPSYRDREDPVQYAPDGGMRFEAHVRAVGDGRITIDHDGIHVHDGQEVMLLLATATSFNGPFKHPLTDGIDEAALVRQRVDAAAAKAWRDLHAAHVADHQSFIDRVDLHLGAPNAPDVPTDRWIADHRVGHAESDVDRRDVDQTKGDLVGCLALAGLNLLLSDGRVVEGDDELAIGVVVVGLIELYARVRQRMLGRRQLARREDSLRRRVVPGNLGDRAGCPGESIEDARSDLEVVLRSRNARRELCHSGLGARLGAAQVALIKLGDDRSSGQHVADLHVPLQPLRPMEPLDRSGQLEGQRGSLQRLDRPAEAA